MGAPGNLLECNYLGPVPSPAYGLLRRQPGFAVTLVLEEEKKTSFYPLKAAWRKPGKISAQRAETRHTGGCQHPKG